MKKLALLNRIEKLEAELQDLRIQVAGMKTTVPVNLWKVPYPPPGIAPDTNLPAPWLVPTITCEAAGAQ